MTHLATCKSLTFSYLAYVTYVLHGLINEYNTRKTIKPIINWSLTYTILEYKLT